MQELSEAASLFRNAMVDIKAVQKSILEKAEERWGG